MRWHLRFALAACLLIATAVFLHARGHNEVFPRRLPVANFPHELGPWIGSDVAIPKDSLEVLGPGEFLLRVYQNRFTRDPYVDLFLAYFPSQRAGDAIHSPKNCLPGAGWSPLEASRLILSLPEQPPFPANRYIIAKGAERQLVLYWYWAHNRGVASEYWAKFYLVADSMRLHRSDGALIRVTTPLLASEPLELAQRRLLDLAGQITPILNSYVPR